MAQLVTIRLSRQDAQPWGFRLQGGKDFATPLVVQKVNGGSLAEQAGLIPGDSVIKINSTEVFNLKHKDAQDVIVRSGNNFEVTIQRGGSTWRPQVTPTGPLPKHGNQIVPTVTKTSLAHKPQEVRHSGSGFNSAARPFSAVNGSDGQVKSIVNKQYNTPVGIYSEEAIAETLSAQAEVLAGGVLGVNFKKNEKVYNAANSEVLKMLQEQESDQPEPESRAPANFFWTASHAIGGQKSPRMTPVIGGGDERIGTSLQQNTLAPSAPHRPSLPAQQPSSTAPAAPEQQEFTNQSSAAPAPAPIVSSVAAPTAAAPTAAAPPSSGLPSCAGCGVGIVGVFVRIKDKNLHAECFKCSTCGASLKNQGYFNLNNKLYCDIHAKLAALNNPPPGTEGYSPVPIKPNQKLGASTISAALNAHNLNGSTHSPFTSPTSNHDPGLAAITPIQVSHSRTSSSSSSVGTANSCISSLSPNISPSPEKLSPAHSRQSSGSGGSGGGGIAVQGLGPFLPQSLKTTIATVTAAAGTATATAPASPTIATVGNTMNINETTTINHRQNENDMNSSNRNGTNGTGGGSYIIPQANTYNQFLKEYSNKKANDQATTDVGYKSSMPDVNTAANMTSAVNFTNGGQYTAETSEPIYGTIRADAKIQPNEDFQYITLTGSIIKSVIPPGKGIKTNYKVNQGYSGPKPFNASPSNPPISGPKSPSSYPPPSNAPSWSQPSAPKPATNPYATLPRASAPSAPASQGRFSTYKPSSGPTGFSKEIRETLEQNYEYHKAENHFEDSELIEVNGKPTNSLIWPPPIDDGHLTPTASPLYIAPPETQHVIPKPLKRQEQHHQQQQQQRQEIVEEQSVQQSQQIQQTQQWQSRSAPELNASRQVVEIESSSDSYTSTCTTTTTTSEEYQKMYQQQIQAYQMQQQMYEQSGSEMDYHMDMEVAAMQQQHDQAYLSSSEYMSFQSGRRSAQECAEYISGPLNTYKLIDLVREVTPSPTPPSTKGPRKVEFADDAETKQEKPKEETEKKKEEESKPKDAPKEEKPREAPEEDLQTQRKFQPTPEIKIEIPEPKPIPPTNIPNPVPKEWISPMVKALTTAPDKPVAMTDAQPCESPCRSVECSVVCAKTVQKEEEVKEEKRQEVKEETIEATKAEILREEPAKGSFIASVMATAPTDPVKFMPDINDPVPLPEETEPYMPPPMDMKPYIREDFRPKSPLLNALITAPETPFEPFGHDVAAHFDDLPTPKGKLTMVDALTVAPTRCYTPLNPQNAMHVEETKAVKQKQYVFLDDTTTSSSSSTQMQATERRAEKVETHSEMQSSAFANFTGQNSVHSFQAKRESLAVPSNPPNSLASSQRNSIAIPSPQTIQESVSSNTHKTSSIYSCQQQLQQQQQSMYQSSSVQSSSCQRTLQAQAQQSYLSVQQTSCSKAACQKELHEHEQKISFPPPCPLSPKPNVKQPILSGLHKPETIPKYQKNWTVLPSQRPVRTPEPQELRENVPLAFVDVPKESSPNLQKPLAVQPPASSAPSSVGAAASDTTRASEPKTKTPTVPIIIEERAGPITMAFQSIDDLPEDHSQLHPRPFTPSLINRPAPIVPFYQTPEKLCFEECPARNAQLFDRRSVSPTSDRARSPAPGPPPNPLSAIRAPRLREDEMASPRTVQAGSITTGQSYLGVQQSQKQQQQHYHQTQQQSHYGAQVTHQQQQQQHHLQQNQQQLQQYQQQLRQTQSQYGSQAAHQTQSHYGSQLAQQQQGQVLSHYQAASQTGSKTFVDKPEVVQQQKIGDMTIQKREKESRLAEEQRSQLESKTTTQVGNAQIERRRRVVEEYEHTQTAKTVEIQKTTGDARNFGKGFVANQARRLSGLEQEVSNLASQSQAISAKAANLGETTRFPHYKSPEPVSTFPIKVVLPPHDEPQEATYVLSSKSPKQLGPPPGFQQKQTQQATATSSLSYDASSQSQSSSSAAQSFVTNSNQASSNASKINTAIPVPAFKPPAPYVGTMSNLPDKTAQQQPSSINNTYKPTPSTGPAGFKPPPPQPSNTNPSVNVSDPTPASAGSGGKGTFGATSAPKRGRGILNKAVAPGGRVPLCGCCNAQVRGPFITALGRIWCPDHFVCVNANCRRALQDIGFVEEKGELYCEYCFEKFLAPSCSKCNNKIKGDCLNAIGKHYHPECFTCAYCGKLFGNNPFFLEEGEPYCEADWNELFTTKCFACGFPVEAGDRWVEALNHNYHSQCFNCTACKKNLEGQSFFNKGGRPYCKAHAR